MPIDKERYNSDPLYREKILKSHREWAKRNNYWKKGKRPFRNLKEEWQKQKGIEDRQREELKKIFGYKCILCEESKGRLYLHEINGNRHKNRHPSFYLLRRGSFRKLCGKCHNMVHFIMRFNKSWKEIEVFINGQTKC